MKVTPIPSPLPGEHLARTWPRMRPDTDDARKESDPGWRLRLNYWEGRALTRDALDLEQENRAAHLAWRGRAVTSGIVRGLEVALETPAPGQSSTPGMHFIHLMPGHGITYLGEDVVIPRPLRVELRHVPVQYAGNEILYYPDTLEDDRGNPAASSNDRTFPWAAVLVLRPAEFRHFENLDPHDPCELDRSRDAFADERRQDAAQLRLVALPPEWRTLPALGDPDDLRWRNRLVHYLFAREAAHSARQELRAVGARWDTLLHTPETDTWHLAGLPLALFSSEAVAGTAQRQYFLDRGSVARSGGMPLSRTRPAARLTETSGIGTLHGMGSGTAALWRARVDQFAEHLAAIGERISISEQAQHFQFLPPAGLLPKSALNILTTQQAVTLSASDRAAVSRFFPPTMAVEAVPIPLEDLDAALAASACLSPYDLAADTAPSVRMLVPLPLKVFDPNLLVVEQEDPLFAEELGRLVAERQDWRQRRDAVRLHQHDMQEVIAGASKAPRIPPTDTGQLEAEPVEDAAVLGFNEALLSPATSGSREIHVDFDEGVGLSKGAMLALRIRADADLVPGPIEVRWRQGKQDFRYRWETPPDYPLEQRDDDGNPLPTPLWRIFTVKADTMGLTAGTLDGFTLLLERGRIAISDAWVSTQRGEVAIHWQPSTDDGFQVRFNGGEWTLVTGDALLAPFEDRVEPAFNDGLTLDERLAEFTDLPKSSKLRRKKDINVEADGLQTYVEALQSEIAYADDRIDLGFLKAQSNKHRITQVLLGTEVANDLLISPTINSIVDSKSAKVSQEALAAAFKAARQAPSSSAEGAGTGDSSTRSPGSGSGDAGAADTGTRSGDVGASGRRAFGSFASGTVPASHSAIGMLGSLPTERVKEEAERTVAGIANASLALDPTMSAFMGPAVREDVLSADPSVGQGFDLRTLTISRRFDSGPVRNTFDYADVGMREAIGHVAELDLGFDDEEEVPDVKVGVGDAATSVTFRQLVKGDVKVSDLRFDESIYDPEGNVLGDLKDDTGGILARGIRRLDATVLIFRRFEYYIAQRRKRLERAKEVLAELRARIAHAGDRLGTIEGRLAEARHDVSVARALRQEEQQRVDSVNARRDTLIGQDVTFLAFVRPRTVDPARRMSSYWRLELAGAPAPVPACLQQHGEPPDPVRAYLQLFRHAPARWFTHVAPRMAVLNTREKLYELVRSTELSARRFVSETHLPFTGKDLSRAPRAALQSGYSIIQAHRSNTAGLTATAPAFTIWSDQLRYAKQHASLGDVIDGRHGSTALARGAAEELDRIEQVSACLHAEFAAIPPAVRLAWIERYSQFDRPSPLDQLYRLPHFERLDRVTRRRLQEFADWLFGRVDRQERDALNLVNDLVRICMLLASHAPVKTIIAGHIPRPLPVRPGILIPIRPVERLKVRVGMGFQVWRGATVVAQGRVEDLDDEDVTARVEWVDADTTMLAQTMQVHFRAEAYNVSARKTKQALPAQLTVR